MPTDTKELMDELDKLMDNFIDDVHYKAQQNLIDDGKVDTATLVKTSNVERHYLNKSLVFPALYADSVEYGRAPGSMPPVNALKKWVKRKLGIKNEAKAKSVAFAIAKSIEKRGINPSPFLRPAIDYAKARQGVE